MKKSYFTVNFKFFNILVLSLCLIFVSASTAFASGEDTKEVTTQSISNKQTHFFSCFYRADIVTLKFV
jgi:hypothetical protein